MVSVLDPYPIGSGRRVREDGTSVNLADIQSSTALEIARGNFPGASPFASYGELDAGGAVTDHLVWPPSGNTDLTVPASPGDTFTVTSTSAQDAAAGTGIRELYIHYLDTNLTEQVEVFVPTGLTPKNTTATDIRFINCVHASVVGSGGAAAGNISFKFASDTVTHSYIPAGKRRCSSSARRVPAGKRLIINGMAASSISATADTQAQVRLVTTKIYDVDLTESAITYPQLAIGVQNGSQAANGVYFPIESGIVVAFEATVDKAATIGAAFWGWIEDAV